MQRLIREAGDEMKPEDLQSFQDAFEKGELLKPEVPGHTIARFVVNPHHDFTGKFLKWVHQEKKVYEESANSEPRVTGPELAPFRDE